MGRIRWRLWCLWLALIGLAGCDGARSGTFLRLRFERDESIVAGAQIALTLSFDGQSSTAMFGDARAPLTFPFESEVDLRLGSGALLVDANLLSADGQVVAHAADDAEVLPNRSTELALRFANTVAAGDGGAAPSMLVLSAVEHDFGIYVTGGQSLAKVFTVRNAAARESDPLSVVRALGASDFALVEDGCGGMRLGSGATCSFALRFAPTIAGAQVAQFIVSAGSERAPLLVRGRALGPGALSLSPSAQTFPSAEVDTVGQTATFVVTNTGTATLGTSSPLEIALSGSDASSFRIASHDCPPTLAGGAQCSVFVEFHPAQIGAVAPTLVAFAEPGGGDIAALSASAFTVLRVEYEQLNEPGAPVERGHGRVVSDGIDCGSTRTPETTRSACSKQFDTAAAVTLHAMNDYGFLREWAHDCTGAEYECVVDMSRSRTVKARFSIGNYLFVTDARYTIAEIKAFGTGVTDAERMVSGADVVCAMAKAASANDQISTGNYRAWISTSAQSAKDRILATGARGWGTVEFPIADRLEDLITPSAPRLMGVPRATESAVPYDSAADVRVWTGTSGDGTTDETCNDWSSTSPAHSATLGHRVNGSSQWTAGERESCADTNKRHRLYCFGVDRRAHVVLGAPSAAARRIFISATDFDPSTGIASADAKCQAEALTANLPGSYKSMLATSMVGASDRFNAGGDSVVRPDGVVVALNVAAFLFQPNNVLRATINVEASGRQIPNSPFAPVGFGEHVLTGAPTQIDFATNNCSDWSSASPEQFVNAGSPHTGERTWFNEAVASCGAVVVPMMRRIYCLQE